MRSHFLAAMRVSGRGWNRLRIEKAVDAYESSYESGDGFLPILGQLADQVIFAFGDPDVQLSLFHMCVRG
jgi:hypothetical protein